MRMLKSVQYGIPIIGVSGIITISGNTQALAVDGAGWQNQITVYGWFADISGTM